MNANDFSDNTAKNEDLSPGAKWCISLWTIPDLVIDGKPLTDLDGKEFRHEGKRYWLDYTKGGIYFLFYFRDSKRVKDINKKIALTLRRGSSYIESVTLADDTKGYRDSDIERVQEYWDDHYYEYESQINHIQEVSEEDYPKFQEYEKQKEKKAKEYLKSHIMDYFTYNESTGRYDSNINLDYGVLYYLVKDNKFTVPLGVINGSFDCRELYLKTLKNGPTEVKWDFDCSRNLLTTLEYAPKEIGGNFCCDNNPLQSKELSTEVKGRVFY